MDGNDAHPEDRHGLSRRAVLKSAGASAVWLGARPAAAANQTATPGATPVAANPGIGLSAAQLDAFDAEIDRAMHAFDMVGAAVALVGRDGMVHQYCTGWRDQTGQEPVSADTHFLVASTTKSMSSLLAATFVDDGALQWDQPVREVWSDFRAPTDDLTQSMRVRDLFGMASGIGEPPALSAFHEGDPSANELLQSLVNLPVIAEPDTTFFYNNTVFAAGGYLPALLTAKPDDQLQTVYTRLMTERVYGPAGMTTARLVDDPRPFVTNYATGYAPDLATGTSLQPYATVGAYAPVGGTLATLKDMAAYIAMQLNGGVGANGARVVSAENLAACWEPGVAIEIPPGGDPELTAIHYGMGWLNYQYRDGLRLVWHNGGIDGFSTFIGFFPDHDLGVVILTNIGPLPRGLYFPLYLVNSLIATRFGHDTTARDIALTTYQTAKAQLDELAAQSTPVDPSLVQPFLGQYEKGWRLELTGDGALLARQGTRAIPLLAMPDGSYVMASGVLPGNPARLFRDDTDHPWLEIKDLETVRWLVGPEA